MPIISVLLPVYNAEKFVGAAIDSILTQSYNDFELIIINDGSTDGSEDLIKSYADPRIVYLENETNKGLVKSLNSGLAAVRGIYIARMDADDISCSDRFEKQVNFLERRPEIGVLGGAYREITSTGQERSIHRFPLTHHLLSWSLCYRNPIAHPSVMLRKDLLTKIGGYPTDVIIPEDYYLWCTLNSRTMFANLPDILIKYRLHGGSISVRLKAQNHENRIRISQKAISSYLETEIPLEIVRLLWGRTCESKEEIYGAIDLIHAILKQGENNKTSTRAERSYMRSYSARKILGLLRNCPKGTGYDVVTAAIQLDPGVLVKTAVDKLGHYRRILASRLD